MINIKNLTLILLVVVVFICGSIFLSLYRKVLRTNVETGNKEFIYVMISTGSTYRDVLDLLVSDNIIKDTASFNWVARKKNYPRHVNPGRYRITMGMNNNQLINMLRSGRQEPVNLLINNVRTTEKLASVVSRQIEADSLAIMELLRDRDYLNQLGFSPETVPAIFIPNTYEFYWNTDADEFIGRMKMEYDRFWNSERTEKAAEIGLTPVEVITLASIVDEETVMKDEEKRIAGVYMNRLRKNMRLQADPTIKYVAGDMNMSRVLRKHIGIDSPYNTYKYGGLPPGPITVPSVSSIDAVLDYERHDFLYMCAKDDFSGYHNFSKTLAQHNKNALSYQKALNRRKILN
jgi:UPF0755 protein